MDALYMSLYPFVLRYPYTQAHVYLQFSYHMNIFRNNVLKMCNLMKQ